MEQLHQKLIKSGLVTKKMLKDAVHYAKEQGLFTRLNQQYTTIPEGECGGCAACCMESVETYWLEFLQIYDYLAERPDLFEELLPQIISFYLLEGVEKSHCPFQKKEKGCGIYPVRPLPCRLFGQWEKEDYEANYLFTLKRNQEVAEYYQSNHQLTLPSEVVQHKVPYCQTFKKEGKFTEEGFFDLLDNMMVLQSPLLMEELVDEDTLMLGLVSWLVSLWFDLDELQDIKVAVMKEFLMTGNIREWVDGLVASVRSKAGGI